MAASTRLTCLFGSPPNAVGAPEKSLAAEATCACTSIPMTISQSPLAPAIRFFGLVLRVSWKGMGKSDGEEPFRPTSHPPQVQALHQRGDQHSPEFFRVGAPNDASVRPAARPR